MQGEVWTFGWNAHGQLGLGDVPQSYFSKPTWVQGLQGVQTAFLSCGHMTTGALTADGEVWTFGDGSFGQLGHGDRNNLNFPKRIATLQGQRVLQISLARDHSIALTEFGEVWTFGSRFLGRLGHGRAEKGQMMRPVEALMDKNVVLVCAGGANSAVVSKDGKLYTFGLNNHGQNGNGSTMDDYLPRLVSSLRGKVKAVSVGDRHMLCLLADGSLYSWGHNEFGQLGLNKKGIDNALTPCPVEVPVENAATSTQWKKWAYIYAGSMHSAAIDPDGVLYTWGRGDAGQLGHGDHKHVYTPKPVRALMNNGGGRILQVALGRSHSLALSEGLELWGWGCGKSGQLGKDFGIDMLAGETAAEKEAAASSSGGGDDDDDEEDGGTGTPLPEPVEGLGGVCVLACGRYHTAVLIQGNSRIFMQHVRSGQIAPLRRMLEAQINGEVSASDEAPLYKAFVKQSYVNLKELEPSSHQGWTPLHYACDANNLTLVRFLLSFDGTLDCLSEDEDYSRLPSPKNMIVRPNISESKENMTPLHIVCAKGHVECLRSLIAACASAGTALDFMATTRSGKTALHLAVEKGHMQCAKALVAVGKAPLLFAKDQLGKRALDYCSFEEGFELKVVGDAFDICIACDAKEDRQWIQRLCTGIESSFIKCIVLAEDRAATAAKDVAVCKGIIWVISDLSIVSPVCLNYLDLAKASDKVVFPIWKKKVELSASLESVLYRRQLVDFTDDAKFNENVTQLVAGLRNILGGPNDKSSTASSSSHRSVSSTTNGKDKGKEKVDGDREAEEGEGESKEKKESDAYLFIACSDSDEAAARVLQASLQLSHIKCVSSQLASSSSLSFLDNSKITTPAKSNISALITSPQCWGLILLLSSKAVADSAVKDQVALAENHKKFILPLMLQREVALDTGLQYTLAKVPKFYFVGWRREEKVVRKLMDGGEIMTEEVAKIQAEEEERVRRKREDEERGIVVAEGKEGKEGEEDDDDDSRFQTAYYFSSEEERRKREEARLEEKRRRKVERLRLKVEDRKLQLWRRMMSAEVRSFTHFIQSNREVARKSEALKTIYASIRSAETKLTKEKALLAKMEAIVGR
ncbi:Retinoic acid induced 14 [Balamuthia mandrillaris]